MASARLVHCRSTCPSHVSVVHSRVFSTRFKNLFLLLVCRYLDRYLYHVPAVLGTLPALVSHVTRSDRAYPAVVELRIRNFMLALDFMIMISVGLEVNFLVP